MPVQVYEDIPGQWIAEVVGCPHPEYGVGLNRDEALDDLMAGVIEHLLLLEEHQLGPHLTQQRSWLRGYVWNDYSPSPNKRAVEWVLTLARPAC